MASSISSAEMETREHDHEARYRKIRQKIKGLTPSNIQQESSDILDILHDGEMLQPDKIYSLFVSLVGRGKASGLFKDPSYAKLIQNSYSICQTSLSREERYDILEHATDVTYIDAQDHIDRLKVFLPLEVGLSSRFLFLLIKCHNDYGTNKNNFYSGEPQLSKVMSFLMEQGADPFEPIEGSTAFALFLNNFKLCKTKSSLPSLLTFLKEALKNWELSHSKRPQNCETILNVVIKAIPSYWFEGDSSHFAAVSVIVEHCLKMIDKNGDFCHQVDSEGRTPLHILLEKLFIDGLWYKMHQLSTEIASHNSDDENTLWDLLSKLITNANVNLRDNSKVTPYTWILLWRELVTYIQPADLPEVRHLTSKMKEMDTLFLERGASEEDALQGLDHLRETQLKKLICKLIYFNHSSIPFHMQWSKRTNADLFAEWDKELQMAFKRIRDLKSAGFTSSESPAGEKWVETFRDYSLHHFRIRNENHRKLSDGILDILGKECDVQTVFEIFMKHAEKTLKKDAMNTYDFYDKLKQILAKGAIPTKDDIIKLSEFTVKRCKTDESLIPGIQTIGLLIDAYNIHHKQGDSSPIKIYLNLLQDLFKVSKDLRIAACGVIRAAYGSLCNCVQSGSAINILLFLGSISNEGDADEIKEAFRVIKELVPSNRKEMPIPHDCDIDTVLKLNLISRNDNWLQRNVLHLAAIFCHDEEVLKCIPKEIIESGINTKDIHGSTPLHLAYSHDNQCAIRLLESYGAEAVEDYFKRTPQNLENPYKNSEAAYQECCNRILKEKSVFATMKPMLALPVEEFELIQNHFKKLFEGLAANDGLLNAEEVNIVGSLREKLKVGRFDEVDLQIVIRSSEYLNQRFSSVKIHEYLVKRITETDLTETFLKPVIVRTPWKFIWEGNGCYCGQDISVDVVPISVTKNAEIAVHPRKELLLENAPGQRPLEHLKWHDLSSDTLLRPQWNDTVCRHEWDILDSLPHGCRLGILIAKTLLEAIDQTSAKNSLKKSITSYRIKNALFYILAGETHSYIKERQGNIIRERYESLRQKLTFKGNAPRWMTEEDLKIYGEEGRSWAEKIFDALLFQTTNFEFLFCGFLLNENEGMLQPQHIYEIVETCKTCLERLRPEVFFDN